MAIRRQKLLKTIDSRKTIAIAGDSVTANNYSPTNPQINSSHGYMTWANILSDHRLLFPRWNFGVGGDKSADLLARLNAVIAVKPDYCVVEIGGNDVLNSNISASTTISNLKTIWDRLYSAGIFVIAIPIPPRGSAAASYTDEAKYKVAAINNFIISQQYVRKNFEVVDILPHLMDYSVTTGLGQTKMTHDGTHPGTWGAFVIGRQLAEVIKKLEPSRNELYADPFNTYHATNNPFGNLITNGMMIGASGSKSGGTGEVASNWGMAVSGGVTYVASKITDALNPNIPNQRIVVSGTAGGSGGAVVLQQTASSFVPSTPIEAICQIAVTNPSNISSCQWDIRIVHGGGTLKYATDCNSYGTSYNECNVIPTGESWRGTLRTPPFVLPADTTEIRCRLLINCFPNTTFSGTVDVGRVVLRHTPNY